jgi:hypothetical protein
VEQVSGTLRRRQAVGVEQWMLRRLVHEDTEIVALTGAGRPRP